MAILVEFGISAERFELGRIIGEDERLTAELERIVPTEERAVPYVWVTGPVGALDDLTASLEESDLVDSVSVLDELTISDTDERQHLYRVEWSPETLDVLQGIVDADGTILEGHSVNHYWLLRFRFSDHSNVAEFYQYLADNEITDFSIDSIYELKTRAERGGSDDLSPQQREALVLAAQRGYFETPRETTLEEIGDELGITQQAVSDRLRRATRQVVFSSLNIPEASRDS